MRPPRRPARRGVKLEFVASGHARVRVTGSVPLADEEFATVAEGAVAGLIGSFVLIAIWLFLAVQSWRLIVPILLTLVLGLLLTTGFAALAVGTLNLISVAFAVLFVGIAVDFAIQFSVRFREMRGRMADVRLALGRGGAPGRDTNPGGGGGDVRGVPGFRADLVQRCGAARHHRGGGHGSSPSPARSASCRRR